MSIASGWAMSPWRRRLHLIAEDLTMLALAVLMLGLGALVHYATRN